MHSIALIAMMRHSHKNKKKRKKKKKKRLIKKPTHSSVLHTVYCTVLYCIVFAMNALYTMWG